MALAEVADGATVRIFGG